MSWEPCAGGTAEYVSGDRSRHWWRCPSCLWVGFVSTGANRVPIVATHLVVARNGAELDGQLDLFGIPA